MENALIVGLSRQVALRRELDVVANNMANINTSGFKSEHMIFQDFLMPKAKADAFPLADQKISYVEDRGTFHDLSKGDFEQTDAPLDVAIDGDGYFVVQAPGGERLTRNGSFQINAQGQLVTTEGYPVLGAGGPINFAPNESNISIGPDGTISSSEGVRGRIRIARVTSAQGVVKEGSSLFRPVGPTQDAAAATVRLRQGVIEKSNVQPIFEMSRMIELTRAYESLANMIQKTDDMRKDSIGRLAEVPA